MIRSLVLLAALAVSGPVLAQEVTASFEIPVDDGYGIDSCVDSADSCGAAIARGWCVANGYDHAVSFNRSKPSENAALVTKISDAGSPASIVIVCAR